MELGEVIRQRRSIRRFKQQDVPTEMLRKLIDAARMAPSAANRQKLRYLAINDRNPVKNIFELTRWAAAVAPKRTPQWGVSAPTAFIAVCIPPEKDNLHLIADAGAAIQNILLRAVDNQLGCCWIGAFDRPKANALLFPDGSTEVLYLVAVGYPDETPVQLDCRENDNTSYFLTDDDTLCVPKLTVDDICKFI